MLHSFFPLNVLFVSLNLLCSATAVAFSVELIHRDSPESPLYDPTSTPLSRLRASIHRSVSRVDYLADKGASALLTSYLEDYLMAFYIGSHRMKVFASIDTGSDLIWLLCHPCIDCYPSHQQKFSPGSSTSYRTIDCHSEQCSWLPHECIEGNNCKYTHRYLDSSSISGLLSTDKLEIESADGKEIVVLKNIIFGCTYITEGHFFEVSLGIIGLNGGPLSFVSQLGSSYGGRMFSYCLSSSLNESNRLYFGSAAKVSGPGAVTTPMVISTNSYKLTLQTITVADDQPINVPPPEGVDGNIIIDSGTFLTYIDKEVMLTLGEMVKKHTPFPPIGLMKNILIKHDLDGHFQLCFNTNNTQNIYQMPEIKFTFAGDATFVLKMVNAFVEIDDYTLCLSILSNAATLGMSFFGSISQINNRIEYDLDVGALTFRQEDCSL